MDVPLSRQTTSSAPLIRSKGLLTFEIFFIYIEYYPHISTLTAREEHTVYKTSYW